MSANVTTAAHLSLLERADASGASPPGGLIDRLKENRAERLARDHLAELDQRLLADIGIAHDEVALVRARVRFTPRAWLRRRSRSA